LAVYRCTEERDAPGTLGPVNQSTFIVQQATLERITAARPATPEELLAVKGVDPRKLEQFGPQVLAIVAGQEPK
jgi:superfamily II DNA helicase RecQ